MGSKVAATILFLILGPLYFALIIFFSFKTTILRPVYLKRELDSQKVYSKVLAGLPELTKFADEEAGEGFPARDVVFAIQANVTPADLQRITELTLSGVKGSEVQKNIYDNIQKSLQQKFNSLPVCTGADEAPCRPSDASLNKMLTESKVAGFPVGEALNQTQTIQQKEANKIQIGKYLPYLFTVILGVILVLLSRLFAGSYKKILFPIGLFSVIIGAFSFFFGFLSFKLFMPQLLKSLPLSKTDYYYQKVILPFSTKALSDTGNILTQICYCFLGIGGLLIVVSIILSLVLKKNESQKV